MTSYLIQNQTLPGYNRYKLHMHNGLDQHTLQALAWRKGKLSLGKDYPYLELARYKGKFYVSFPPTPTLVEFPFTFIFGQDTPNNLTMLLCVWLAMLMSVLILEKLSGNTLFSYIMAFAYFWGTQIFYISLAAPVWHQGHMFGVFFSILGLVIVIYTHKIGNLFFGALMIGLAIGCRPFYFLYIPLYIYLAGKRFPLLDVLAWTFLGLLPMGTFLSLYNYYRFDDPFNFGHVYLSHESSLSGGIFNFDYLPLNLENTFLTLPYWDHSRNQLAFNLRGTSVFLVNPVLILAFFVFFRRQVPTRDKIVTGLSLAAVWVMLLLHFGNGWTQFGYRYCVDFIPILLLLLGWGFKDFKRSLIPGLIPLCIASISINIYGALWFYILRFMPT